MVRPRETLKMLAERNWRGVRSSDLVYSVLDTREKLDLLEACPDDAIGFQRPSDCPETEWIEDHRYFWNCELASALKELERRRHINRAYVKNPDREVIAAIKADMPVEDVIEWYTEVSYSNRTQYKFRCTLHGEDKSPSGVIYRDEKRWWCFGCTKGGDVFDAVQAFERCDLPRAIRKLATHLGIELRPLKEKPRPKIVGGVTL